jgi:hypothetical protein
MLLEHEIWWTPLAEEKWPTCMLSGGVQKQTFHMLLYQKQSLPYKVILPQPFVHATTTPWKVSSSYPFKLSKNK